MKTLTLFLVALFTGISYSQAQVDDYSFKEDYKVSSPAQLSVSSHDGNIDVVASNGDVIEVYYIAKKNGKVLDITRAELEKDLIIEVDKSANSLKINVENRFKNQNWTFSQSFNRVDVNFKILVPKQTACNLHTSDGNVVIAGLNSDQEIKTSDGNIEINHISGNVKGRTSDGNVRVDGIKGSLEIATSDGNIHLKEIRGSVQASTSDGNIELSEIIGATSVKTSDGDIYLNNISGSFKGITSDGNVRGNVVDLKNELIVKTGDGNISIKIPGQLGLDLEIRGESLNVPLTNFSGKSDKKVIQGKSNGGGIAVNLSTSDGNITLGYL